MKIGLVIWSIFRVQGGIQRFGVNLAHAMQKRGHKCTIFFQRSERCGSKTVYPVDDKIDLINLDLSDGPSIHRAKKKVLERELDVMCAMFSWDALLWMPALMKNTGIPFIISVRNNPQVIENERWNAYEHRACLAAADLIHVQTKQFRRMLPSFLHDRTYVFPNFVDPALPIPVSREQTQRKRIIAAGRMVDSHKRFTLLLQAFKILASKFEDWDLCICGDGTDWELYKHLVNKLAIHTRVLFPGMVDNIDDYYAASHIFCIPSRYEGFPNTLMETQRHGLPAVGFSSCSGTNEIIIHGENGLLVPEETPSALAASLHILMKNQNMRQTMGERAQELLSRYDKQTIMDRWEELFTEAAKNRGQTRLGSLNWDEQTRTESALKEILIREHPFSRLLCEQLEKETRQLEHNLHQSIILLRHNDI